MMKSISTPVGRLELVCDGQALTAIRLPNDRSLSEEAPSPILEEAARQLTEYFSGQRHSFDLPLRPEGTVFQQAVWRALAAIPFGETRSYADVARAIGRPGAFRAVGAANGRNPLAIVLPCHRVIGSDGSLTGYAGGEEMKAWLLRHESCSLLP